MANQFLPNYQSNSIPSYEGLLGNLPQDERGLAQFGSGQDIAKWFGFDPEEYGQYFRTLDVEGISEGLGAIPDLQRFLYSQNRQGFSQQQQGLLGKIGQTNFAGTGSFDTARRGLAANYSKAMFGSDKQIQDLVSGYQNQLNEAIGSMFGTAQNLLAGGAEPNFGQEPNFPLGTNLNPRGDVNGLYPPTGGNPEGYDPYGPTSNFETRGQNYPYGWGG